MSQTKQQAREKILSLAKQGDPATLAGLLKRKLRDRAIAVHVERQGGRLSVALEAEEPLEQGQLVESIARAMKRLQPEGIKTLEIVGSRRQALDPDWVEIINLDPTSLARSLSAWLQSNLTFSDTDEAIAPKPTGEDFLRFHLTPDDAALLPIRCVKEVLQVAARDILPVPHTHEGLVGVYNWRGEMLWLIDLKCLLGFATSSSLKFRSPNDLTAAKSSAIALSADGRELGLLVDRIEDIEQHDLQNLELPDTGLFGPQLLPFVQGYLTAANALVLEPSALLWGAQQLGHMG